MTSGGGTGALLRAVRMVDGVMVRALGNIERGAGRGPRPPGRLQSYGWRHPVRAGVMFGGVVITMMTGVSAAMGWRIGWADAPAMALAWVVPGLVLALALRWERMAHENVRHVDPDLPVKVPSGRRIATRLGIMWALLTVMFWAEDASKGRPVYWPAYILLAGALMVFALAVGYGVSRAARRRRGK
ncbi:hypothetical protein ACIBL6_28205 [Streptomyces sp. NPDC050400]|uniref:hypothetical protein n=1 Tax=Streptomyces sp. NPDC050400 TaxID=3365610 RepID=UPI003792448C